LIIPIIMRKIEFLLAGLILASLACQNSKPKNESGHFNAIESATTGVDFTNQVPDESAGGMNIIQYLYYYNGGGVATADFNNDGLCDLFFTANLESNRLYFNRGAWKFEDVTAAAGVGGSTGTWNTGVSVADVNADGWLDIYVCRVGKYKVWNGRNQLWINQRDGTFRDEAAAYGLDIQAFSTQAAFFDYDLDGDLDCFLLCHSVHSAGSYRDTSLTRKYDPLAADRLLENRLIPDGKARFVDISTAKGIYGGTAGYGLGLVVSDLNRDGWPDIYVANDFHENDYLYLNQRGKRFRECITRSTAHTSNFSMGCDAADLTNDGWPDLLSLDMKPPDEPTLKASQPADGYEVYQYKHAQGYHWQFPRNALQVHQGVAPDGTPLFAEVAQLAGLSATDWSWAALLADLDLDGWKDVYITNGIARRPNDMDYIKFISTETAQKQATDRQLFEQMPAGAVPNACFRNRGQLRFDDVAATWGLNQTGCSNGAAYADLDNDGDLDLVTNNLNAPASLLRNDGPNGHFLALKCHDPGSANPFGIGCIVEIWIGDSLQVVENQVVRGFQSSVSPVMTVGLGAAAQADSLRVRWPSGRTQMLRQIAANQIITLHAKEATKGAGPQVTGLPIFAPRGPSGTAQPEVPQFFPEKLQPWLITTPPEIRITADWDADGRIDTFVGHRFAAGKYGLGLPYAIRLGRGGPSVTLGAGDVAAAESGHFNDDKKMDIAVAGEWGALTLWLQQPDGSFRKQEIPQSAGLWQALHAADLDADGDLDLVAGNLGLNHDLRAPELWLKDYDNNGQSDPILAYERQGKRYVFADKDLITNQLPMLRKSFVEYRKYADSDFDAVLTPAMRTGATALRTDLLASVWVENKGNDKWAIHPLPMEAQFSSVHAIGTSDFDRDGHLDILIGGNLYEVSPAIGRMDASRGLLLRGTGRGGFVAVPMSQSGLRIEGQIRAFRKRPDGGVEAVLADGRRWIL
jgi:enediyne biosynthesis protein E4